MKISARKTADSMCLVDCVAKAAFVGMPCDERGEQAVSALRDRGIAVHHLVYMPETISLSLDGEKLECDELSEWLSDHKTSWLLEGTTLGTTELVLATKEVLSCGSSALCYLYVEPQRYKRQEHRRVIHARDFSLTRESNGFQAVPGFAYMLDEGSSQSVLFFLGFEGERLDQAFEQLPIQPRTASAVFGVPAFQPGWEVDSFANNARLLRERGIGSSLYYCGANDAATTFRLLERIYGEKPSDQRLFVAPIGTKPQCIGLALFLANHCDVGFIYDHPVRGIGRSTGAGSWHVFDVAEA